MPADTVTDLRHTLQRVLDTLNDSSAEDVERARTIIWEAQQMTAVEHCRDCCCARSWAALGITSYTGKSIPEHIAEVLAGLREALNAYILETPYQRTDHEMVGRLHGIIAKASEPRS